jgi:hypothetical protein
MAKKKQKKTHDAWEGKDSGIEVLNDLFGASLPVLYAVGWDKQTGRLRPFRRKPGVPNMRPDAVANSRRLKRKRQRAARRRNRGNF